MNPALPPFSETRRKWLHVGITLLALAVGRTANWFIVVACAAGALFAVFILPRLSRRQMERPLDRSLGWSPGMVLYPVSLCLLAALFYNQQIFVVIGWGALAFGDSAAHLVGVKMGRTPLPWNRQKTWLGFLAGFTGSVFGALLLIAVVGADARPQLFLIDWIGIVVGAAAVAACVETLPGLIDDNLVVPFAAGCSAWLLYQLRLFGIPELPDNALALLGVTFALVVGSLLSKKIDLPGATVGGLITFLLGLGAGWWGVVFIALFFAAGTAVSQWGRRNKAALGLAQEAGGKRSVRNAVSNAGVAGIAGLVGWLLPTYQPIAFAAIAGALATAASDTFSSELGNLYGSKYYDLLRWRRGERGRDGVVSWEGSLAGVVGAAIIALGVVVAGEGWILGFIVWIAALLGNLADSAFGGSLQRRGLMTNDTVNFFATLTGGVIAAVAASLWL